MISEVFNIDCLEYMKQLPDKFFDLAIVDPPYGINAPNLSMGSKKNNVSTAVKLKGRLNSGGGKLKNRLLNNSNFIWDNQIPKKEYFNELFRVSKNQIIWGGNYFPLPPTRGIIAWNKLQPWENFSQFELAWTSFDIPAKLFTLSNTGGANKEKKIHPTQKPIELYKYLISKFSNPGDKIFDSHLGSQSSRIAAYEFGFDFWGCELDKDYFEQGNKRFEQYRAQQKLF